MNQSTVSSSTLPTVRYTDFFMDLPPDHLNYIPPRLTTFITAYLIIVGVTGIIGNGMTIISIVCNRKLRTIPNVYVANLAITDFLMCLLGVPFSVYAHNEVHGLYATPTEQLAVAASDGSITMITVGEPPASSFCQLIGAFTLNSMCMSMYNLGLIAINRYILLVRGTKLYSRLYTKRNVILSVFFIYVLGIVVVLPPLLGWGKICLNPKMGICLFADDTETYWYVQAILHGVVAGPAILTTVFCYCKVICFFRRTQAAIRKMQKCGGSGNSRNTADRSSRPPQPLTMNGAGEFEIDKKVPLSDDGQDSGYDYKPCNKGKHHTTNGPFSDEIDTSRLEELDLSTSGSHSEGQKGVNDEGGNSTAGEENGELSRSRGANYKIKAKRARASRRVLTNLMTVFLVFILFWMPIIVIFTVDYYNKAPAWVSHLAVTFAISNSCVNVFIYAGMNRIFRRSYINLLTCKWSKLRSSL